MKRIDPKALSPGQYYRGGIIPYIRRGHEVLFCLAVDKTGRGYIDFGGGVQKDENILDTAIREFKEETNSAFGGFNVKSLAGCYFISNGSIFIALVQVEDKVDDYLHKFKRGQGFSNPVENVDIKWFFAKELLKMVVETPEVFYEPVLNAMLANIGMFDL